MKYTKHAGKTRKANRTDRHGKNARHAKRKDDGAGRMNHKRPKRK